MTTLADAPFAVEDAVIVQGRTPWQLFWARFKQDRLAMFGLGLVAFIVVLALAAPLIASATGHGPNEIVSPSQTNEFGLPLGPNSDVWLGADRSGRDILVRLAYGARVALLVGIVASGIALTIGVVLGILGGYFGGWADSLISRGTDIVLALPLIIFAIGIVAACSTSAQGCLNGLLKPGLTLVIVIIALFSWPQPARLVRGATLSLREKEFVEAARSLGASERRIMFRELLPNLVAPIIVWGSLLVPSAILFEAYLSFLGLGVPGNVPSWGKMLSEAVDIFGVAWWFWLFPGIMLMLTVLAFNLLGDGLRDALDPRTGR
jgi:ABC-type dipeptide/oligopeptide/nickel transport system permease subunit